MAKDYDKKTAIKRKNEMVKKETNVEPMVGRILDVPLDTPSIDVFDALARAVQYTNIANALAQVERTAEYVVQVPLKYKEALQSGELLLNQNSQTGVLWPTLYRVMDNGKRKFVDNLPIKQENIIKGNPFESIAISYHNLFMQQQMSELADKLEKTYRAVERIEQGQMDDRIGTLLAGRDQIILSMKTDPQRQIVEMANGRSNMLKAQRQILQTFKRRTENFEAIPKSTLSLLWMEITHPGVFQQKGREFYEMQQYYELYLQATQMIAASYAICGQSEEAERVFDMAQNEMKLIDFTNLKTLDYIQKKKKGRFYHQAATYVATEKAYFLECTQEYNTIDIHLSGAKLLEVFENGKSREVSESDVEP